MASKVLDHLEKHKVSAAIIVISASLTVLFHIWNPWFDPLKCIAEVTARSTNNNLTKTPLTSRNATNAIKKIYWLDGSGIRHEMVRLAPGQEATIQTYLSHVFVITNENGLCSNIIIPSFDNSLVEINE